MLRVLDCKFHVKCPLGDTKFYILHYTLFVTILYLLLPVIKIAPQFTMYILLMPIEYNLSNKLSWSNVSNTLAKSRNTPIVDSLLSRASYIIEFTFSKATFNTRLKTQYDIVWQKFRYPTFWYDTNIFAKLHISEIGL